MYLHVYLTRPHKTIELGMFTSQPCSGQNLNGSAVGAAFVRAMCDQRSSVSLTEDRSGLSAIIAGFAAHEIGHLFNMGHDMSECFGLVVCAYRSTYVAQKINRLSFVPYDR